MGRPTQPRGALSPWADGEGLTTHLLDTDRLLSAEANNLRANCGEYFPRARVTAQNDWAEGQCKEWLDKEDICELCRLIAMKPNPVRYTYGVIRDDRPRIN